MLNLIFSSIKLYSLETIKSSKAYRKRIYEVHLLKKSLFTLRQYNAWKIHSRHIIQTIADLKNRQRQATAIRSLKYFADKASALKHDKIKARLLYSDHVIFDESGELVIVGSGSD